MEHSSTPQGNIPEGQIKSPQQEEKDTIRQLMKCISTASKRLDICADPSWQRIIASNDSLVNACIALAQINAKVQLITEITDDNVQYCKEIMKFAQLRHKDHIMEGMWAVTEKEFTSVLPQGNGDDEAGNAQWISSKEKKVLALQKFVFDRLWSRGTPAEARIHELENGSNEKTEVLYGAENAVRVIVEGMAGVKREMIACTESASIGLVTKVEAIKREYLNFKQRGVNFRSIFEITKENLAYVKELTQYAEIRHLDGIRGNFAVTEKEYMATATINRGNEPVTEVIRSTSRAIMEQHRYFFESLWSKSIPADQKIREIEEGIQVQKIEIIRDPRKSITNAVEIMESTQKEFQVLFATHHTFALAIQMGALESYKRMLERGATLKILVPRHEGKDDRLIQETTEQTLKAVSTDNIKLTESDLNTRITIMISDRKQFMTWELKDDSNEDPYQAAGVATYSNMETLATSYAIIFESLWNIAEMYEKLKLHDRAQNEFIGIVAHELRTPIQPILGLAEIMREDLASNAEYVSLADAIIRNAKRLQNLQEDILDVARIESNMLRLNFSKLDINETIRTAVEEIESGSKAKQQVTIAYEGKLVNDGKGITVYADGDRIAQVLRNLLENALKFTAKGTIRISADVSDSGKELTVSIQDTGTGMDQEIVPRLFQKFAAKSAKGTGLGLYICRKIVESHGGKIWAKNNDKGQGATFYFSLPVST